MEDKRFTLRMDGELFKEISQLAKNNRRSVAKEIECAIAEYLANAIKHDLTGNVQNLSKDELIERLSRFNELIEESKSE